MFKIENYLTSVQSWCVLFVTAGRCDITKWNNYPMRRPRWRPGVIPSFFGRENKFVSRQISALDAFAPAYPFVRLATTHPLPSVFYLYFFYSPFTAPVRFFLTRVTRLSSPFSFSRLLHPKRGRQAALATSVVSTSAPSTSFASPTSHLFLGSALFPTDFDFLFRLFFLLRNTS